MREGVTKEETDIIEKLEAIDINKEYRNILNDADKYFQPYLKKIKNPIAKIFVYFSIFAILKKIDTSDDLCNKAASYFLDRYSVKEWLNKLIDFYNYTISGIDYILNNHDNSVLDYYNKKQISKETMIHNMKSFVSVRNIFLKNKEMIEGCIGDLEKEKENFDIL